MTSVLTHKAQPAHHLYIATGAVDVQKLNTSGSLITAFSVSSGDVLADMGKTMVLATGTYKKVQLMPRPSAGGVDPDYMTGYICMGDGSAAASSVAVLL